MNLRPPENPIKTYGDKKTKPTTKNHRKVQCKKMVSTCAIMEIEVVESRWG